MRRRIPPSQEMWQDLEQQLGEGGEGGGNPFDSFVQESARYVLQVAVEKEVTEYLGREPYQRRKGAGQEGYRNGYEPKGVTTEGGRVTVKVPQVRNQVPFHSAVLDQFTKGTPVLKRLVLSLYVRGLSTRDIERSFEEAFGGRVLSKSAVSEVTQTLGETFEEWRRRDLSSLEVVYLFLDGFYVRLREGASERAGLLCAYGILETGQKVLLSVTLGEQESEEGWLDCLRDLVERGLKSPLLVIADGAPGLRKAVRRVFPKALFQRCQVHKMRNFLCKLPRQLQGVMKGRLQRVFHEAPDYATAVKWGKELMAEYRDQHPSAMECLEKDLEECLTYLKFPKAHGKRIRTTNLLERTFGEGRRRTKVVPFFFKERAGLNLVFASLLTASKKWRGLHMTPAIQLELKQLREKLYGLPPKETVNEQTLAEAA